MLFGPKMAENSQKSLYIKAHFLENIISNLGKSGSNDAQKPTEDVI